MTQNGQRITPLQAAKQIYVAFGEQTTCMGSDEMFDHINVSDATKVEELRTMKLLHKVAARVRKVLRL